MKTKVRITIISVLCIVAAFYSGISAVMVFNGTCPGWLGIAGAISLLYLALVYIATFRTRENKEDERRTR